MKTKERKPVKLTKPEQEIFNSIKNLREEFDYGDDWYSVYCGAATRMKAAERLVERGLGTLTHEVWYPLFTLNDEGIALFTSIHS